MNAINKNRLRLYKMYESNHYNRYILNQITDNVYVYSISKNGCSSLLYYTSLYHNVQFFENNETYDTFKYQGLNIHGLKWNRVRGRMKDEGKIFADKFKKGPCDKIVMIYRDPIERVISAKNTIAQRDNFETFLEGVINTFTSGQVSDSYINMHILPQSKFIYNVDDIDLFVDIKNYQDFIRSLGIEPHLMNGTNPDIFTKYNLSILDKYKPQLMEIYKDDYELINNIPNDKKFVLHQ